VTYLALTRHKFLTVWKSGKVATKSKRYQSYSIDEVKIQCLVPSYVHVESLTYNKHIFLAFWVPPATDFHCRSTLELARSE